MNNVDLMQAEECLIQMGDILIRNGTSLHWAKKLHSLASKKTMCADDFRQQVKGLYGGMGSLNDLVICDADGKMDRDLNVRFDELRSTLYNVV
ncbi:hypothetical protein L0664_18165 [Octadecabacter sp. G9-8]|uniref:DUF6966 domain-containing protein n=1 Tax=Octadecabacter dasysiphoniae TaxID=2909341 RepID=A0ABS9D1P2_9RHOB|nr:hypothetical protein [Octadecabacter dasysiphoniae]MCF2872994.1 hypothetical protein [Octadecabacter dasysiphoniae]